MHWPMNSLILKFLTNKTNEHSRSILREDINQELENWRIVSNVDTISLEYK